MALCRVCGESISRGDVECRGCGKQLIFKPSNTRPVPDRRVRAPGEIFPDEKPQPRFTLPPKPGYNPTQPDSNLDLFEQ